jgi:hypothetical protein
MSRKKHDPRFTNAQGVFSKPRAVTVEALETFGKQGATNEEIFGLIGQDIVANNPDARNPLRSLANVLRGLRNDGHAVEALGKWFLKEHAPAVKPAPVQPSYTNGVRPVQVAAYTGKRSAKNISIYTTPETLNNAIGLTLVGAGNRQLRIPFFGNMRICIGMEAPMWSPEQETYGDVEAVRILLQGGGVKEITVNPRELVTIAAEE